VKVRTRKWDDDTLYRTAEFTVGDRTVQTPVKALELHKVPSGVVLDPKLGGVSECFRTVSKNQIAQWMTDSERDRASMASIVSAQRRAHERGDVHVLVMQLDTTEITNRELAFVSDTAHSFSDVVTVPLEKDLHKAVKGADSREFKRYVGFTRRFVEEVEKMNGKPLMAMVPSLPWQFTADLTKVYLDLGMRAFCFDFAGRTPSATEERNIRPFLKELRQQGIEEEVMLYALNANTGKAGKRSDGKISPAKDILSFGFGFDVLGQKHIGLKGPKEMYAKMAKQGPTARLFDKDAYGYRKSTLSGVGAVLPRDTQVSASAFRDSDVARGLQAYVNMEQQALEANRLRRIIGESSVPSYLQRKSAMEDSDRRRLKDARRSMSGTASLDDEW